MFDWYRLFNKTDFEATGLTSYSITLDLEGVGLREVMIVKGNTISLIIDELMLAVNLNGRNPFRYGTRAVWLDDNDDVWLGVYRAS